MTITPLNFQEFLLIYDELQSENAETALLKMYVSDKILSGSCNYEEDVTGVYGGPAWRNVEEIQASGLTCDDFMQYGVAWVIDQDGGSTGHLNLDATPGIERAATELWCELAKKDIERRRALLTETQVAKSWRA